MSHLNPLLTDSRRPLPKRVAIIGSGTIGPDIAYYLKSALPEQAIRDAAAAPDLVHALEIGYRAFGASACTAAAKEGVSAFLERRKPDFTKTG